MSDTRFGPVTTAIRRSIRECQDEINRLTSFLDRPWSWRRARQLSRREIKRCIVANKERVIALRHAEELAIDVEGWTIEPTEPE